MTLARDSWWPQTQALRLELGHKRRIKHDCGDGATLLVGRDEKGYRAHCFRCSDDDWMPPEPEALGVRLARLTAQQQVDTAMLQAALPTPALTWPNWPATARLWLLKAGLSGADAWQMGAYYHPPSARVVLPVLNPLTGMPQFWQARSIDGRQPKYINPPTGKAQAVPQYGKAERVTLTEDILSAYKVGKVGEGWCLMGTSISDRCLTLLMLRGCSVNIWLDPDKAGVKGAKRTSAALRGAGIKYRKITSTRDPKLMHVPEIRALLEEI